MDRQTTLERAYALARTGQHTNTYAVQKALGREGYSDAASQLYGKTIRSDITRVCREAAGLPPHKPPGPAKT